MPLQPSTHPATLIEPAGLDRPDPELELRGLYLALSEGEGFRLILATYDVPRVRNLMIDRLRADLEKQGVRLTCLDASVCPTDGDLLESLQEHLAVGDAPSDDGLRPAVAIVNLETCLEYQRQAPVGGRILRRANLQRDAFAERIRCPVVFWLMPVATSRFALEAPDLWHWRIATFDFTGNPKETVEPSDLTRATSFQQFRGLPSGKQHEGIAALQDRLLQLEHSSDGRPITPREQAQRAALLDELGRACAAMGRRDRALPATAEAVEICRGLAAQRPDAFLPDLAASLNNLGVVLRALGQPEAARDALQEALSIRRHLAQAHPAAFEQDVADTLNNLGIVLSDLGRRDAARDVFEEAVRIYEPLAERWPEAFGGALAIARRNYGSVAGADDGDAASEP